MRRNYRISFIARRVSWLPIWVPFNRAYVSGEKETTWQEAHHMAEKLVEGGAHRVAVTVVPSDRT